LKFPNKGVNLKKVKIYVTQISKKGNYGNTKFQKFPFFESV